MMCWSLCFIKILGVARLDDWEYCERKLDLYHSEVHLKDGRSKNTHWLNSYQFISVSADGYKIPWLRLPSALKITVRMACHCNNSIIAVQNQDNLVPTESNILNIFHTLTEMQSHLQSQLSKCTWLLPQAFLETASQHKMGQIYVVPCSRVSRPLDCFGLITVEECDNMWTCFNVYFN